MYAMVANYRDEIQQEAIKTALSKKYGSIGIPMRGGKIGRAHV